ncbi:MAG: fasciclin domain-containing protein, partial [Prevotellaceae bacterium]|nr:fasciclin domain-containing protein [Prevotellaceae bacterium]
PDNQSIMEMIDKDWLPTWQDYNSYSEAADRGDAEAIRIQKVIASRIQNFVRYHIQDNSVYIGGKPEDKTKYETSKLNPENNRFYSLEVTANKNGMEVKDYLNVVHKVNMTNGLYNNTCSEYWIKKTGSNIRTQTRYLYATSHAVVHQINGVLLYDESQKTSWKEEAGIK